MKTITILVLTLGVLYAYFRADSKKEFMLLALGIGLGELFYNLILC